MPTVSHSECVVADQVGGHLAGENNDRDRIHQRVGEAGDGVGGAGAGGDEHRTDFARRTRIAFGGMHRALLVADENVLQLLLLEHGVVDRQHRAARVAENVLDPLIHERLDHHLGAGHFGIHGPLQSSVSDCACWVLQKSKRGPRGPFAHRQNALPSGCAPPGAPAKYGNNIAHRHSFQP